ncbi:hypothetical protein HPP92_013282 [Vanilla planifolia]|uniref:Uncharacterized protein n=1 Tax=Vanilla planifolia TaxID=51239 RepID=A0A835UYH2_VANPL|nr:hypothetical protein HPP92_013282 [Vanilla planifolia]
MPLLVSVYIPQGRRSRRRNFSTEATKEYSAEETRLGIWDIGWVDARILYISGLRLTTQGAGNEEEKKKKEDECEGEQRQNSDDEEGRRVKENGARQRESAFGHCSPEHGANFSSLLCEGEFNGMQTVLRLK